MSGEGLQAAPALGQAQIRKFGGATNEDSCWAHRADRFMVSSATDMAGSPYELHRTGWRYVVRNHGAFLWRSAPLAGTLAAEPAAAESAPDFSGRPANFSIETRLGSISATTN